MNPARLVQSIGWMAFLAVLLAGGGYASYIAAWQQSVLIAATAVFGLLVLADAVINRHGDGHGHEHHDHGSTPMTDQWVQTLVHLLPLFLFLTMGVTTLGSQSVASLTRPAPVSVLTSRHATTPAATSTDPGSTTPSIRTAAPTTLPDAPTPAEPLALPPAAGDPALPPAVPLPLMDLYFPGKHVGVTRIETIGRLMIPTPEEVAQVPPEVDRDDLRLLLYRYVMTCCAADAQPVFVVLRRQDPSGFAVDDWVSVTGTWIPAAGQGDMAKIEVDSLRRIEQPAEPFLMAPKE